MDKLVSIGFNTSVNKSKIILIMPPGSAPIKRKIQEAREIGKLVDVVMEGKHVLLSFVMMVL